MGGKPGYNLNDWLAYEARCTKRIKLGTIFYLSVIMLFFSVIGYSAVKNKTEILLTIDDYSFAVSKLQQKIFFTGVVPFEALEDKSLGDIKQLKLYFSQPVAESITKRKKTYLNIISCSISEQEYDIQDKNLKENRQKLLSIKLMKAAIFSAVLSAEDIYGTNIYDLFVNKGHIPEGDPIYKVKLVLGNTSLLSFWMHKLFSKEPLFKKAGQLVD